MGNSSRKLTVEQVLEARLCYMVGDWKWSKLARKFGVGSEAVKAAAKGDTYKVDLLRKTGGPLMKQEDLYAPDTVYERVSG
jgi:hypothetical protein